MTWVRIDDGAPLHPKLLEVGPEAAWLWVAGLAHCNRSTTDGVIRKVFLPALYPSGHLSPKQLRELAARLVAARLWHDEGDAYRVHQYEIQQELAMKEEVEARRAYERERKTRQRRDKLAAVVRDNAGTVSGTMPGRPSPDCAESPTPGPARPGPTRSEERETGAAERQVTAEEWTRPKGILALADVVRSEVVAVFAERRLEPPRETRALTHGAWTDIARFVVGTRERRGLQAEPAAMARDLVRAYYASTDPRTVKAGHPIAFLAARPEQYIPEAT